ncbi:hypothetical protein ACIQZO_18955 [Streptomyces sp. NPDC097617]|uniref:hypothetical protein n=1 Tax=Streptomyces sp. NPDC097617 TaxID=3366091 RepID=UPI003806FE11
MADPSRTARARAALRALAVTAVIAPLSVLSVGCSDVKELGYTPARMDPDPARAKTKAISARLLEMTGVKGTVTQPGPTVSRCSEYGDDLFSLSHPWSIYEISDAQVETGMSTLRERLTASGWKITKDGKAKSQAQSPEIYAEDNAEGFAVLVTGHKQSTTGGPMLLFKVVSHCYRAESAASLDGVY